MPRKFRGGEHLDTIVTLVAGGMTVTAACASNAAFPKPSAIADLCRRNPEFRERLQEAFRVSGLQRRFSEVEFDQALAAIRLKQGSLRAILVPPLPPFSALIQRAKRDPAFAERYRVAVAERDSPHHLNEDAYAAALDLIKAYPAVGVRKLLVSSSVRLPSRASLDARIKSDAEFAARAAPIRALRRETRAHQRKVNSKPRVVFAKNLLAKSLRLNHFYAVADRAVPKHLDEFDRDDIRSEIVAAMLAGSLSVDDSKINAGSFVKDFMKRHNRNRFTSLDSGSRFEDGESWVDTMTVDEWVAS